MKYFKMTNRFDPDDQFYSSSDSDLVDAATTKRILCLDDYEVEEVTEEEFNRETADPKVEALELLDELKEYINENLMDLTLFEKVQEITRKVEEI